MGSTLPVLDPPDKGSAPNTIKCLSVSEVITCKPLVGTLLAPLVVAKDTALVDTPSFSTHLKIPPARGFIIKSSPKLSCVHILNWFVSDRAVSKPHVPAPQAPTDQPVDVK